MSTTQSARNPRQQALDLAVRAHDGGALLADLARRVAFRTESQEPARAEALHAYLSDEIAPALAALGFRSRLADNPAGARARRS